MSVLFVTPTGVETHDPTSFPELLARGDGFLWVDLPAVDEAAATCCPGASASMPWPTVCRERNHVPPVHGYADHVFLVTHAPELGAAGHVHLLELDVFLGEPVPGHRPRPDQPGAARGLGAQGDGGGPRADGGRSVPPDQSHPPVLRDRGSGDPPAARHDRRSRGQNRRSGAAGDDEQPAQPGGSARGDVPDPPRAVDRADHGGSRLRGLRPTAALATSSPPKRSSSSRTSRSSASGCGACATGSNDFLLGVIDLYQTRTTRR